MWKAVGMGKWSTHWSVCTKTFCSNVAPHTHTRYKKGKTQSQDNERRNFFPSLTYFPPFTGANFSLSYRCACSRLPRLKHCGGWGGGSVSFIAFLSPHSLILFVSLSLVQYCPLMVYAACSGNCCIYY